MARAHDGHRPGPVPPGTVFRNKRGVEWTTADWTPGGDRETQLRRLHAAGLSLSEIGRRMGIGKDAAISKARKLDLKGHQPTPKLVDDGTLSKRQLRYLRRRDAARGMIPVKVKLPPWERVERKSRAPRIVLVKNEVRVTIFTKPHGRVVECSWPTGTPGKPDFKYCDDPSEPGKSYCLSHCRDAYATKRQKDAA